MTKFLFFILFIGFFSPLLSCQQKGDEHLPPAKMEQIMFDISIAESYSTKARDNSNFGGVKNMDSLAGYYTEILAHHKVSAEQFSQSLNWYKNHPDNIDSIYTHLTIRADKQNAEESRKKKLAEPAVPTPTPAPTPTVTIAPVQAPTLIPRPRPAKPAKDPKDVKQLIP